MPHMERAGDTIKVTTAYNDKELIESIPGSAFRQGSWWLPLSWASCQAARGTFGQKLTVGPQLADWVRRDLEVRIEPSLRLRAMFSREDADAYADYDLDSYEGATLKPFQALGLQWMMVARSGLLADEMGSGKTVQTLQFIDRMPDSLPALVIVPNSLKFHWKNLSATWAPNGAVPYVVDGTAVQKRKMLKEAGADPNALVIINMESVRSFSRVAGYGSVKLKRCRECDPAQGLEIKTAQCECHEKELNSFPFRTVVVDEIHRLANPKSLQTRACWWLLRQPVVNYRWGLTGTATSDHPGQLWPVMHGIAPEEYPVKSKWVSRYCLSSYNQFGGLEVSGLMPETKDEFFRIFEPRFRRMLKAVTQPQLPPVTREVRTCEMTAAQRRMYEEVNTGLATRTPSGELVIAYNDLTKVGRLQKLAAAAGMDVQKPDEDDILTWEIHMKEPSPKLDVLEELLDDLGYTEGDGPAVVIAAENLDLVDMAAQRLTARKIPYLVITGAVSPQDREAALQQLRDGTVRILLFTIAAGAEGLDMSAADTLINLQRSWSLVKVLQTEGRVHRMGSEIHKSVRIIDIVTRGTVEEEQISRVHRKIQRLEEINRDQAARVAAGLPVDERLSLEEQMIKQSQIIEEETMTEDQTPEQTPEQAPEQLAAAEPEAGVFYQPEVTTCPGCGKINSRVKADGTMHYHLTDKPECQLTPGSRKCRGTEMQWNAGSERPEAPEHVAEFRYTDTAGNDKGPGAKCRVCGSVNPLYDNGRIKSHPVKGGTGNCPGGADWPEGSEAETGTLVIPPGVLGNDTAEPEPLPPGGAFTELLAQEVGDTGFKGIDFSRLGKDAPPRPYRVLGTGSRRWGVERDPITGELTVDALEMRRRLEETVTAVFHNAPAGAVLVHGANPNGADALMDNVWTALGGKTEPVPARWESEGGRAGRDRNELMAALGADEGMAFILDLSTGASHMLSLMKEHEIPVTGHYLVNDERGEPEVKTLVEITEDEVIQNFKSIVTAPFGTSIWHEKPGAGPARDESADAQAATYEKHSLEERATEEGAWRTPQDLMYAMSEEVRLAAADDPHCATCLHPVTPLVDRFAMDGSAELIVWACREHITSHYRKCRDHVCMLPKPGVVDAILPNNRVMYTDPTGVQWEMPADAPDVQRVLTEEQRQQITELHLTPDMMQVTTTEDTPLGQHVQEFDVPAEPERRPDQVVSATKMTDWQTCKRAWWLKWYRGLSPLADDLTGYRNVGIRIHEALAGWYAMDPAARVDPRQGLETVLERDRQLYLSRHATGPENPALTELTAAWDKAANLERAMVSGYVEWLIETGNDSRMAIVGSEVELAVSITDPADGFTVQARGVLDARVQDTHSGVRRIIDHKTVGDFSRPLKFLAMKNQPLHYALLEWLSTEEGEARCDGVLWNMLRRVGRTAAAKPPFYARHEENISVVQLEAYKRRLMAEARGMAAAEKRLDAGEDHRDVVPPSPTEDCSWKCDFRHVCPLFDNGGRAEDMLAAQYQNDNPWSRYDRLGDGSTGAN